MRKVIVLILAGLMMTGIAGCGQKNSPKSVTEAIVKCLQKRDYKGYVKYTNLLDSYSDEQKDTLINAIGDNMEKMMDPVLEQKGGLSKYEILEEKSDEEKGTATVSVKYFFGNGDEYTTEFHLKKDPEGIWKMNINN